MSSALPQPGGPGLYRMLVKHETVSEPEQHFSKVSTSSFC